MFNIDWTDREIVLHSFAGGSDGANPAAGVIHDSKGNLYGTTVSGGTSGLGIVFKINPDDSETILHTFGGADGANPYRRCVAALGDDRGKVRAAAVTGLGHLTRIHHVVSADVVIPRLREL